MIMNEISHNTITTITLSNGEVINVPEGKFRLIYNDESEIISIRSGKYNPLTNSQIRNYFSRPINEGLVNVVNEGTLNKGAKYFLQMELPDQIIVCGKKVKGYLTALDSRTGNSAFALSITPIFVVCNNAWAPIYSNSLLRIGHLSSEEQVMDGVIQITEEFTKGVGYSLSEIFESLGNISDDPKTFLSLIYSKELNKDPDLDITNLKDYSTFMELYESHDANIAADVLDAKGLQKSIGIYTYMVSNTLRGSNPIDLSSTNYARGSKLFQMQRAIVKILA